MAKSLTNSLCDLQNELDAFLDAEIPQLQGRNITVQHLAGLENVCKLAKQAVTMQRTIANTQHQIERQYG